jgi:phosphoglycolate phosphatase
VPIRAILFDLDGTLVQTREASWLLFEETNRQFALGVDSRDKYFALFRTNFFRALAEACGDSERFAQAKAHFLNLLRTRYTPIFVPGMADVVRALAARFTLVVLSANTTETIRRVLTEAGLQHCFAHVFAGDVEPDKSVSMRRFLNDAGYRLGRRCSPAYDEGGASAFETGDEVVLVTDTVGDVEEANTAGVRSIGVAWGMHDESALRDAGAERVALWPQELCAWLLPEADAGETCSPGACACPPTAARAAPADPQQLVQAAGRVRRERLAARESPRPASVTLPVLDAQFVATLKRLRVGAPSSV